MQLANADIKITIVDDSTNQPCSGSCGKDWSQPEAISAARREIEARFGQRVELEYINLPKAKGISDISHIKTVIRNMPLPVILSNGQPRIAGEFDMRQLMDIIETDLEVKFE
jgi:hypothetical protein